MKITASAARGKDLFISGPKRVVLVAETPKDMELLKHLIATSGLARAAKEPPDKPESHAEITP